MGVQDEDLSLVNRLVRLDKQLTDVEKGKIEELSGVKSIINVVVFNQHDLLIIIIVAL